MKVINKENQFLTGAMYAPFCRTLAAPIEEWEQDIKNMADLGYNCIHGFAEWHDIEYKKGEFDFTLIDHMVDCAHKYGITPIINIATQNSVGFYSPRWLMEELRETSEGFIDSSGNAIAHGQFVVPCIDDPVYQKYATRYLTEVAKHFGKDSRVGGYVLWGEPFLSRPGYSGADICYCEHTTAKFRKWLKERYGTIDKLNDVWKSEGPAEFESFDTVYPPTGAARQRGGFASWEDFKEFMELNLAGHIREADRIFKENGALQPTITEMTTGINQSIDPWKLAEGTDIIGISCFNRPSRVTALYMSIATSMAKALNKSSFVVEAGGGSVKYMAPVSPTAEELKSTLLQRAGHGVKGLMYWCWRPRVSDTEGNDFGLVKPNGKPLQKTAEVGKLARKMNEYYHIYNSSERVAEVAIFSSRQINHIMGYENMKDTYCNSLIGANFMLTDLHINSDFITEKEILKGSLKKYKTLILPCAYVLSEECAKAIDTFVANGGQVIADYILAEKKPGGFCYFDLPGGGLDKVFGFERDDISVIESNSLYKPNSFGILPKTIMELVTPTTAKVLAEYDGSPALTSNSYGKGNASYFTGQFFRSYITEPTAASRKHLAEILAENNVLPHATLTKADAEAQSPLITVTMNDLKDGGLSVITLTNTSAEPQSDTLVIEDGEYSFIENSESFILNRKDGKTEVEFSLKPFESLALFRK